MKKEKKERIFSEIKRLCVLYKGEQNNPYDGDGDKVILRQQVWFVERALSEGMSWIDYYDRKFPRFGDRPEKALAKRIYDFAIRAKLDKMGARFVELYNNSKHSL